MNFGRFDMVLIFSTAIAIVLLSFIMPATGMTSADNASEGDIPEFNISADQWDFAGEFPDSPGTPTSGEIRRFENQTLIDEHIAWIDRPTEDGASVELSNFSGDMNINFNNWSSGSSVANDRINITAEGDTYRLANDSYAFEFHVEHFSNHGEPNMSAIVEWELTSSPDAGGGGLLDSIPVIGGLFNAGEQLVSAILYLGSIMFWIVASVFETVLTVITIIVTIITYGVSTMVWLFTTYFDMVDSAPGWAAVIVAIPGIIISVEFAKVAMIAVRLLPYT